MQTEQTAPTVENAEIAFANGLWDIGFSLNNGGSAHAELRLSDGSVESFSWYHDELTFSAQDFLGKSIAEIRELHYQRDLAYLRN